MRNLKSDIMEKAPSLHSLLELINSHSLLVKCFAPHGCDCGGVKGCILCDAVRIQENIEQTMQPVAVRLIESTAGIGAVSVALNLSMRGCRYDTDGDGNCPRHPKGCHHHQYRVTTMHSVPRVPLQTLEPFTLAQEAASAEEHQPTLSLTHAQD